MDDVETDKSRHEHSEINPAHYRLEHSHGSPLPVSAERSHSFVKGADH
jgi:hypothetical protein